MKILVTGAAGFIGSAVVRQALDARHSVVSYDAMTYAASPDTLTGQMHHPQHYFVQGNICDAQRLDMVLDTYHPDAVMHLAAESHVDRSIDAPDAFIETNVMGTSTLLQAVRRYWIAQGRPKRFRFHHVSTDEVFGSLGATGHFREDSPYAPNSPYAASKAASDHLVRAFGKTYGLPTLISNCSNNYGPYQFPEKLIPLTILNALAGRAIPIYGAGQNVRDWLYVDDHAAALLCILTKGDAGTHYVIGGNAERANLDLVHKICAILDEKCPKDRPYSAQITHVDDRPGHDERYAIDTSHLQNQLGWQPKVGLDQGLAQTIDWYLQNPAWWQPLQSAAETRLGQAA